MYNCDIDFMKKQKNTMIFMYWVFKNNSYGEIARSYLKKALEINKLLKEQENLFNIEYFKMAA